jgi:hypothetical protein
LAGEDGDENLKTPVRAFPASTIVSGTYAFSQPARGIEADAGTAALMPLQSDEVVSSRSDAENASLIRSQEISQSRTYSSLRRVRGRERQRMIEARTCLPLKAPCEESAECCSGYCCHGWSSRPEVCVTESNDWICRSQ